jgi:signal transduction histidine kinase/ligand-binding sensor domain-containing protein
MRRVIGGALVALCCSGGWSRERLHRLYDGTNGLPVSYVANVEQDRHGFLWIGTPAGLVRYDGVSMRRWSDQDAVVVAGTRHAKDVYIRVVFERGKQRLYRVADNGLEPVPGIETLHASAYAVADDGALWVSDGDRILRLDRDGRLHDIPFPAAIAPGELLRMIPAQGGCVLALDLDGLVRLRAHGESEILARLGRVVSALERPDRSVLALTWSKGVAGLYEIREGSPKVLWSHPGERAISVVERGQTIWVALDKGLVALRRGEAPERITDADRQHGGGHMFVDREGSLWASSWRGLVQYPEPETAGWTAAPDVLRYLARAPDAVWTVGWGELQRTTVADGAWTTRVLHTQHWAGVCVDSRGSVWTARGKAFLEYASDGSVIEHPSGTTGNVGPCSPALGGGAWIPTETGLFRLGPVPGPPRAVPHEPLVPNGGPSIDVVAEDGRGELWAARGERLCHTRLARDAPARVWICETIPGAGTVQGLLRVPPDGLWVATQKAGVFRVRDARVELIPASQELPVRWIERLAPSPRGGVWISGNGFCVRVLDRPDLRTGWEVVERLSFRNGLPSLSVAAVAEDADGTLWLATDTGLVRMPPSAREDHSAPPESVAIVEAVVDGKRVPVDRRIDLPYHRNRLELRFASLSFIDPASVRYRVRLRPADPWSDPIAEPVFRYVDVAPGRYQVEVAATLDGERWSPRPARVEFTIGRPWYAQIWFFGLVVAALAVGAVGAHRVRLRAALRLERERMRIAMDLHDGMGSGLGSIGILASLAASEGADERERRDLAREIATAAGELGHGLTDIVASLRPGATTLGSLGRHLVERGRRMFPDGATELVAHLPPEIDEVPVSLGVRRNVLLVGLEALHNVAKHAAARHVVLSIEPAGRLWRLVVEDDGCGVSRMTEGSVLGGLGIESMRRRASEIGADLAIGPRDAGGTVVSLEFDPRVEDRNATPPRPLA